MDLVTSVRGINNSKLFFSKNELSKILACYSIGVSKGDWKDYSIYFGIYETSFYMFKHTLTSPDCILTKSKKYKKNLIFYDLEFRNFKKSKFTKIDDLIAFLKRSELKVI